MLKWSNGIFAMNLLSSLQIDTIFGLFMSKLALLLYAFKREGVLFCTRQTMIFDRKLIMVHIFLALNGI